MTFTLRHRLWCPDFAKEPEAMYSACPSRERGPAELVTLATWRERGNETGRL